jgi:hypothetical protein
MRLDGSEARTSGNRPDLIPDGNYRLGCIGVEDKKASSGRDMVVLSLEVLEGAYSGKKINYYLTLIPEKQKGHGMTVHAFHAFGLPFDGDVDFNSEDFKGLSCQAQIIVEDVPGKGKWAGKTFRNSKIADFFTDEYEPPPQSSKAQMLAKNKKVDDNDVPF